MIFVVWLAGYWTSSRSAQHLIVAAFYAAGLLTVAAVRRRHRFTYRNGEYTIAEALLWLGIYLAINLQLSSVNLLGPWWAGPRTTTEFSRPFYWATWVLIWCLPPVVLARGLRQKDRFVIAVAAIAAILTLVTNKPYLGWQPHTWDPMLLGALLIGVVLFIRRWLAAGPGGNPPRLYRSAPLGEGQVVDERRGHRIRTRIVEHNHAKPANREFRLPLRWWGFGRRRC
jgi:hypothetical protein